jgi:hypothetical protein
MRMAREKLREAVLDKLEKGEDYDFWLGFLACLEEENGVEKGKASRLFSERDLSGGKHGRSRFLGSRFFGR